MSVDILYLVCHINDIGRDPTHHNSQMTITAAVKYTALRNGTRHRYIVTLSNGTVAKREGVRTYNYLAVPTDKSGSYTNGSRELQPLVRMCGGSLKTVIVETATGRVIDCSKLAKHNVERRAKAQAIKEAAQQKRLQQFVEKAPKQVLRKFKMSQNLFRGWLTEWAGKDQDRVNRLNDLIAWRERCIEMLQGLDRAALIGLFNTGTTSACLLEHLIDNSTNQPK